MSELYRSQASSSRLPCEPRIGRIRQLHEFEAGGGDVEFDLFEYGGQVLLLEDALAEHGLVGFVVRLDEGDDLATGGEQAAGRPGGCASALSRRRRWR